ncbi:hypothetical protein DXB63_15070 [Bacteroides sp. OM05-12]|nr:hypothetical protein DXB63_15070 [Bacteroides sp. OM05-12]
MKKKRDSTESVKRESPELPGFFLGRREFYSPVKKGYVKVKKCQVLYKDESLTCRHNQSIRIWTT